MTQATGYIWLTYRVVKDEETGQFMSSCDDLGTASCADTIDDALAAV